MRVVETAAKKISFEWSLKDGRTLLTVGRSMFNFCPRSGRIRRLAVLEDRRNPAMCRRGF
ncbi:hypothetical protein [Caballeronia sp. GAFFF1]|uniref:hypothetical protein n=1 Tax=Caballeronia sp. GAFFF1 TaxID=2921779 RepID=UPI00253FA697|nr:hypothetical protein [Caballeronia sp. GAFFF1]